MFVNHIESHWKNNKTSERRQEYKQPFFSELNVIHNNFPLYYPDSSLSDVAADLPLIYLAITIMQLTRIALAGLPLSPSMPRVAPGRQDNLLYLCITNIYSWVVMCKCISSQRLINIIMINIFTIISPTTLILIRTETESLVVRFLFLN